MWFKKQEQEYIPTPIDYGKYVNDINVEETTNINYYEKLCNSLDGLDGLTIEEIDKIINDIANEMDKLGNLGDDYYKLNNSTGDINTPRCHSFNFNSHRLAKKLSLYYDRFTRLLDICNNQINEIRSYNKFKEYYDKYQKELGENK